MVKYIKQSPEHIHRLPAHRFSNHIHLFSVAITEEEYLDKFLDSKKEQAKEAMQFLLENNLILRVVDN